MKKLLTTLILLYTVSITAQNNGPQNVPTSVYMCYVKYTYDANGNRTNRAYSCEWYNSQTQQSSRTRPPSVVSSIVFPNPNNGVFTFSSTKVIEGAIITIKNMQGQTVKTFAYNGYNQDYDLRILPVGQYLIEILSSQNKEIIKMIKKE